MRQYMDVAARVAGIIIIVAGAAVTGCAEGLRNNPFDRAEGRSEPAPTIDETDPNPDSPGPATQDTLAEVEAFLESVRQYTRAHQALSPALPNPGTVQSGLVTSSPSHLPDVSASAARSNAPISNAQVPVDAMKTEALKQEASQPARTLAIPVVEAVSIQSSVPPTNTAMPDESTGTANTAIHVFPPESTLSVEEYIDALRDSGADLAPTEAYWRLRMLLVALGREAEPVAQEHHLSPESSDILEALTAVAADVRRVFRDPFARWDRSLASVADLHRLLAESADLQIPTVAFCREVRSFGSYDPMLPGEFIAGRANRAIVYCEIDNLQSKPTDDGLFKSVLATRMEVFDVDGKSVWHADEPEIIDNCRRRRTDFFIAQRAILPPTLPAGEYTLKITVEDTLAGKTNEATHPFQIHGPASLASGG